MPGAANAATEIGVVTLVEGSARVLRGATWYKLAAGHAHRGGRHRRGRCDRAQVQLEFARGHAGETGRRRDGLPRVPAKARPSRSHGAQWLAQGRGQAARRARAHGAVRRRRPPTASSVMQARGPIRRKSSSRPETRGSSNCGKRRRRARARRKRGEYWTEADGAGAFASHAPRAPKAFVDAMPRQLRSIRCPRWRRGIKSKPALVVDHEITYAEAEPWLAGRDRAAFERRFASRLRDPAFRRAVEPHIARYPSWDRMLHPEKYAPKPAPVK